MLRDQEADAIGAIVIRRKPGAFESWEFYQFHVSINASVVLLMDTAIRHVTKWARSRHRNQTCIYPHCLQAE